MKTEVLTPICNLIDSSWGVWVVYAKSISNGTVQFVFKPSTKCQGMTKMDKTISWILVHNITSWLVYLVCIGSQTQLQHHQLPLRTHQNQLQS